MRFVRARIAQCSGRSIPFPRLVALVPKQRVNLTRFDGVLRPSGKSGARAMPARRGKGGRRVLAADPGEPTPHFGVDVETCPACWRVMTMIARIDNAKVIDKFLTHLDAKAVTAERSGLLPRQGPPASSAASGPPIQIDLD